YSKNVLIHNNRLMITDFGLSKSREKIKEKNSTTIVGCAPQVYCDPQFLNDPSSYKQDKSSDIYSLGVIFWEISSGKVPQIGLIDIIIRGIRETPIDGTPLDYVNIYSQAWQGDPNQRPTIENILNYLEKVNLEPVFQKNVSVDENSIDDSSCVPEDSFTGISLDSKSGTSVLDEIQDQRDKAESYFEVGNYVEAIEIWDAILRNPRHTSGDQRHSVTYAKIILTGPSFIIQKQHKLGWVQKVRKK
ncbi:353_t:CDS:2, partial [Acaulospora colombiana]